MLNLVNEAETDLSTPKPNIGTTVQQLDRTNTTLTDNKNFVDGVMADPESADTFEAAAELQQDQTMPEASYNTLVRLGTPTLNNSL